MPDEQQKSLHHHAWKVRFIVMVAMMVIALLGMVITDMKVGGAWKYWCIMTPVYALLSIGLSLYLRHLGVRQIVATIWHEILHWAGLVLAVYLISLLVKMGFVSRFQAGVEVLVLLALATFLAGVYIDATFLVIGIAIGLLVAGIGLLDQYFWAILIPVVLIATGLIFWMIRRKRHHTTQ